MKPASFEYYAPQTVSEAVATLAQHGYDGKALAGGQSLIPMMNFRLAQPSVLVDLNGVSELFYVRPARDGSVHIGAMTRQREVELDPLVGQVAPLVQAALPKVAYPQIRTRGTFGGSLAHADPSAELPAVAVALDARLRLQSRRGERWVAAKDFFQGFFTTLLEPDELLVEIALSPLPPRSGWSFMEVARRHHDFALAGVAATVRLSGSGECEDARLVYFSVGDGPTVAEQAAALLRGQVPSDEAIQEAARTAGQADVDPSSDINATAEYRRHLVEVLGRRALAEAFGRARGEG
ncbi:MAG: xanthine dehydrogenase family protein subunit M [Anaerolineae bacterium]|nr:xanthine dehydrogenase family protein subunit M [Anaerolineae bacterium]